MKISFSPRADIGSLVLRFDQNCDTDAMPFVADVEIRHIDAAVDLQTASVAAALLFAQHCGDVAEFEGVTLSLDYMRAIRTILPDVVNIVAASSGERAIGSGDARMLVIPAHEGELIQACRDTGELQQLVTWSGDFVDSTSRTSVGHLTGQVFTNAMLVARPTAISIAIGLLVGGSLGLRQICVPEPNDLEIDGFRSAGHALREIGVLLSGQTAQIKRRHAVPVPEAGSLAQTSL